MIVNIHRFGKVMAVGLMALLMALALAACGDDPTPTPTAAPVADSIEDVLYQAALQEGQFVILDGDDTYARIAARGFTARFPGIEIITETGSPTERAPKLIAQDQAGQVDIDVYVGSARDGEPVISRGLLAGPGEIDWGELGYASDLILAEGHMGIVWDFVYAHAYNTDLVDAADVPKTLNDFLDPRWNGQLAASPFLYPAGFAFVALAQGEEQAVGIAKDIFDTQGVTLSNSYLSLLDGGEASILMYSSVNNTLNSQKAGAPVDFFFTEDMGTARLGVGLVKQGNNPNAAKLFFWWLNTPEGQRANFDESSRGRAAGTGVDNEISAIIESQNVSLVLESDANWKERARLTGVVREAVIGQ